MFGLSLGKILVLAAVIFICWRGIGLLEKLRDRKAAKPVDRQQAPKVEDVTDLVPCARCGAYVPANRPCPNCSGAG